MRVNICICEIYVKNAYKNQLDILNNSKFVFWGKSIWGGHATWKRMKNLKKRTALESNKSKSELVLAVKSGEDRSMRWVGSTIGVLLILAGMVVYVRRKI